MSIIAIVGNIGSGKSFTQLKTGIEYAETRQKSIVANFPINTDALKKVCLQPKNSGKLWWYLYYESRKFISIMIAALLGKKYKSPRFKIKYPWILKLIETNKVHYISSVCDLNDLMRIPESVVLLDEAGVFLNSREFAKTPKELLVNLAQSRKDGIDLIYAAQFDDQVDRQFRMLTQFFVHCSSLSYWDNKLRRPRLFYKNIKWFIADHYYDWNADIKAKTNPIKTRFAYATKVESGLLNNFDEMIFDCFDSFRRLDKE
jgi:hypothetical protein